MAAWTYSDLKSKVADWAARSDFSGVIPDFIMMAEALFNNGDQEMDFDPIRVREMEAKVSLTVTDGAADLPDDFAGAIRVVTSAGNLLTYATPEWISGAYPSGDGGYPQFYTILGSKLLVSTDVDLTYYARIPSLSDATLTNWLLERQPTAYLYASLYFLSVYAKDMERAPLFRSLAAGAVIGLAQSDRDSRAGNFTRRANGPTP
jgi:hypothetical protein